MNQFPCLIRSSTAGGEARFALGEPLVDSYLAFVAGRCRPNTLRAVAHDLKTFFTVVDKDPVEVVAADIFDFVADQRGDRSVVRISDGESGLSARTIARRLSSVSGFYAYLVARGDTPVASSPVARGLSTRRRGGRRTQVPLVRVPRTLPKILSPSEVTALLGALRTDRDRAMVYAMVLGGLRRCEVLGFVLATSRCRSGRCSSPKTTAATSGSSRSRTPSSRRLATTSITNARAAVQRIGCSSR
jgi:site-specific recombinase XerD